MSINDDDDDYFSYNGNKNTIAKPKYFKSNRRIVLGDSGIQTNHYVGSKDEDLYFKVRIVSEIVGNEGITLYYDNPRDYCVHRLNILDKKRFSKNENYSLINNRINKMMSSLSPIINDWVNRRKFYLEN